MITLRCTARAASALGFGRFQDPVPGTSPLGDWYVNLIPTAGGGLFLFVSERSLLAVVVPRGERAVPNAFVLRVANLLAMIGIPHARIEEEIEHFAHFQIGKTASRRILGVMNDLAFHCQAAIDEATPDAKVSLSDLELDLARIPRATLGFRDAREMAVELLAIGGSFGAA